MNPLNRLRAGGRPAMLACLCAFGGVVAGCGDDEESAPSAAAKPAAAAAAATGVDAEAAERVDVLVKGLATAPPATGPKAQPGKSVWAISCGDFAQSCKDVTDEHMEAGKALGWKMTRFDAKVDPARASDGIRQAIAAKADAVVVSAFDCVLIKAALKDADDAGVLTYGSGTSNCDDPVLGDGGKGLYALNDVLAPDTGPGWSDWTKGWGVDKANYVIAKSKGKAKVINLVQADFPGVALISEGFGERIKECSGCEVVETVEYTGADTTNNALTQKLTNALSSNPDADFIHMPVDSLLPNLTPALMESGRSDAVTVVGGEGFGPNLDAIREGGAQDAAVAFDLRWESWSQMDDLNRTFAGEKPVYGGWGYTVIDKDANLPAEGGWNSNVDYRKAYEAVWGGAA